ncbi:MAG: thiamine pyrophosphate-dependent enzyme [Candidatus Nitrosopolaris sp.]
MEQEKQKNIKTADIIAETLLDWGVDTIFGIPGDGINGFIEALRTRQDRIKFVLVKHEESAAFMACAYAKYTGRLGVCVSTSGPGAIHLLNGLYDAKLDNTPVIAITGRTYSDLLGSGYQQDVNQSQLFSDVALYNNMILAPEHAEMVVDMACRTALSQKGVSHFTIPVDIQDRIFEGKFSQHKQPGHTSDRLVSFQVMPADKKVVEQAAEILNSGTKIVILVGQGAINATQELTSVAEKLNAPIVKALLGKAVIPDNSPYNLGVLGMLGTEPATDAMTETDTLLMVGTSFPYIDYLPKPGQARGVQIDIKPENIGLRYPIEHGLLGDAKTILAALLPLLKKKQDDSFLKKKQSEMNNWINKLQEDSRGGSETEAVTITSEKKDAAAEANEYYIKPQTIAAAVSEELDDNAIISVDSGTNTFWAARYFNIKDGMKFSVSGTLASMACGLPYAIAAQIAYPDRQCVAFVGDGGFMMLMAEFSTAVQYNLPIKVIVLKNNTLGMIRWEQMGFLGNPEYGVQFTSVDFAGFAINCGGKGYSIKQPDQVQQVMRTAMHDDKEKKPTLIEAYVDPFEPILPPKAKSEFLKKMSNALESGQPYSERIGLTLYRNKFEVK